MTLLFILASLTFVQTSPPVVSHLRVEHLENPVGLNEQNPRFSWWITSERRNVSQSGFHIQVAYSAEDLSRSRNLVWDRQENENDQSVLVPYEGPSVRSSTRYWWRVRVWDDSGEPSAWSEPAYWETGLLASSDWVGTWIEPDVVEDSTISGPAIQLRRSFEISNDVVNARIYATAHGLYELELNGQRVGDQEFAPGWTSYHHRLQVQTYDVTDLLVTGKNVWGAWLADGWYRGNLAFYGQRNTYGKNLGLLAQIEIEYADGRVEKIGTDASWKSSNAGPVLASDIYNGETIDARRNQTGWSLAGFDDAGWNGVTLATFPLDNLVGVNAPPVRQTQEIAAVELITTPSGETVIDFGQNLVGYVRMRVEGPAGTRITLQHAEVLDADGNFYTENLRIAEQTDTFILAGGGAEVFEPRFTFHGFRFLKIEGYPGEIKTEDFVALVLHTAMVSTGSFETSNPLINRLQENIRWGQRGNFLDVPTDCPQRNERLGWTGDAQVFFQTAAFNYDVSGFFLKWLADLRADQYPDGRIPHVIPDAIADRWQGSAGATGWADAGVFIPWRLFQTYGDTRVLESSYASIRSWVDYMRDRAGEDLIWSGDPHFGDWLAFSTDQADYPGATTSKEFLATAHFAYSSSILAEIAELLDRPEDAARYRELSDQVKAAFLDEFVTPAGRVSEDTQTAYVIALAFDLLPMELRETAAARLADNVRKFGHLTTGFLGTPHLLHVLTRFGYNDLAFTLLNRENYPSWLYPVTQGATTIWERWDGQRPDGSFQDAGMNSFNHYAYGAVGEWMYENIGGIGRIDSVPGFKEIKISPNLGGDLTESTATFASPYGVIESSWKRTQDQFELNVTIPPNSSALIVFPEQVSGEISESGTPVPDFKVQVDARMAVSVGSGTYRFSGRVGR